MTALRVGLLAFCLVLPAGAITAQQAAMTEGDSAVLREAKAIKKGEERAKKSESFYTTAEPIDFTLTTNIKRIRGDKADKAPWRPASLTYKDPSGKSVSIPMEIRTRGIWRLKNCEFPPLRLNFKSEVTKGTLLQGIDKPKLVSFCKDNDTYESFVTQELQLYRIYNLLTPASHRARLLHLTYMDSASGKAQATRMAILLEEPETMAARLGGPLVEMQGATPEYLVPYQDALAAVFQYFIGNTDWSTYALHNVELVRAPDGNHLPIPYDFDFSGVINSPYATVDPKLSIDRVRQRLFRGFCHTPEDFGKVFATFNEKKSAIYALYTDPIGKRLSQKTVDETLKYFDAFYSTINDPHQVKSEILDTCVKVK
jgi:hypothetical protein